MLKQGHKLTTGLPSFHLNSEGSSKWRFNKAPFLAMK